jgi:glycosyltransferase involved in cell wall biosynthesis
VLTVQPLRERDAVPRNGRRRPRVAFVVNGEPAGAMGRRAAAFAERLAGRYDLRLFHRTRSKLASLLRTVTELTSFGPQVCYVFDMAWSGVGAAAAYKLLSGARLVVDTGDAITALASSLGRGPVGVALTGLLERGSLALADRVVVRGSYHREWLRQRGCDAEIIPDGVESEPFAPPPADGLRRELGLDDVLTVGLVGSSVWSDRLQLCYGWDLVELIRLLPGRPVAGVLIGGGSGIPVLQDRCRRYGIADRVRFLGPLPYEELPRHLAAIDVCLSTQTNDLPGRVRTTGKLPLYLASGRFVLASRVGEAARVLGEDMLVDYVGTVDPEYPRKLAARVERLLAEPERLGKGRANVGLARTIFDYDVLAEKVAGVLDGLLGGRR